MSTYIHHIYFVIIILALVVCRLGKGLQTIKYILCFLSILCLTSCTKFTPPTGMSTTQPIQTSDLLPTHTPVELYPMEWTPS
jgi:hypothetical protein